MRLQRQSNGQLLQFDTRATLGAGGEALVFAVPGDERQVAKVYRRPTPDHALKLASMIANPPDDPMAAHGHVSIAWPTDTLMLPDGTGRVVGFVMPKAAGTRALIEFYNPTARRAQCPLFNYLYLHRTARNLAAAVRAIHARGYVIGDLNEMNLLVTDTALVTMVDTDSFQVRDALKSLTYRCPVGRPEFTPPELQGKTFRDLDRLPEHDLFGLGVLIFQLLMEGTHPFAGVYTREGEPPPYEARIMRGEYPYGSRPVPYRVMPAAPSINFLHPRLREMLLTCFEEGHQHPQARPDADAWVTAIKEAEDALVECAANDQHRYGGHLTECPWCARARLLRGRDPFPSRQAVEAGAYAGPQGPSQSALPSAGVPGGAPRPAPALPTFTPAPAPTPRPVAPAAAQPATQPYVKASEPAPVGAWVFAIAVLIGAGVLLALPRFGLVGGLFSVIMGGVAWRVAAGAGSVAAWVGVLAMLTGVGATVRGGVSYMAEQKAKAQAAATARAEKARQAEAADERQAADKLLDEVTASIQRFTQEDLTEDQVDMIKAQLRVKLQTAVRHADRAIELDPDNADGWLHRVRALRISGDEAGALAAVRDALKRFPGNARLLEERDLL